ncbi:CBS domain-containing protein [Bacillus pinisoli]|uniref:CBS domain-containing protein n=1 Tax=Bacillus pinisoli TaxID=2901866 RepID=UPI001FF61AE9|nr:CBS domain-containing protein [Bacillus pinisoli]
MFVKSIMIPKHKSHTVDFNDSIQETLKKLEDLSVDGVPVLKNGKYVGMVTRYHVYECFFERPGDRETYLTTTKAGEIATRQDIYLQGEEIFERTLVMLKDMPILAVVDEHLNFLGVVTRYDVLEQFQSAFGMHRPGVRIAFSSVETEGRIARLAEIAKQYHENIISLSTFDETDKLVRRIVMKVEKNDNIDKFVKKLESVGFRVLDITED